MKRQTTNEIFTIISVEQAQTLLQEGEVDDSNLPLVRDSVVNSDVIVGSSADYHNLAVEMTRRGCYLLGFDIVQKGLQQYPYNIDLLADAVYYGSCAGKFDQCEQYAETLKSRPFALWSWRAYTFMIDYYMDKADWLESTTDIMQSLKDALSLAAKAQDILSTDERGYLAEHRVHLVLERWFREMAVNESDTNKKQSCFETADEERQLAINSLKRAIENNNIIAVQCCLRYADLTFEARDYKETIQVCQKAFCYGESQPSAKMGYFLYLSALSMDSLIHEEKAFGDEARIMECYRMYLAADKTLDANRITYRNNIRLRINNLQVRTGIPLSLSSLEGSVKDCSQNGLQTLA